MTASSRARAVAPFLAMDMLVEANRQEAAGRQILHLEIGQPGLPPPAEILAAAEAAIQDRPLGYTEALGLPALRAAIAADYRRRYGLDLPAERVALTMGSSAGLLAGFLGLFESSSPIGILRPGYPAYRQILGLLGHPVIDIPCGPQQQFRLRAEDLAPFAGQIGGLVLTSPNNPTGAQIRNSELRPILDWCRQNGVRVIMDEIYHGLSWSEEPETALLYSQDIIVANGFSKYFGMTGWRLGWMVVPEALVRPIEAMLSNMFVAPPTLAQYAALTALQHPDRLDQILKGYRGNRDRLIEGLLRAGFDRIAPADGAFYLYVDISKTGRDSLVFARDLLEQCGIAATPGHDFDPVEGGQFLRLSYAGTPDVITAAADRLAAEFG